MPRGGQRHNLESAERLGSIIWHDAGYRNGCQDRESVLPQVLSVVDLPRLPVFLDVRKQVALSARHPDPSARLHRPTEALSLIAVMVRHQHIGDTRYSVLAQVVQY